MALVITSAVITNLGENLIASAVTGGGAITLTSVEFGSGFPATGDNIATYTGLKTFVMNGQVTSANNAVQSQATIRVNVSSANAPSTFQVNEIGIFAAIGAGAPVLLAYASTGGPTGDTVTPSSPTAAIVKDYALLILFTQNVPSSTTVALQQVVGLHAPTHILPGGIDPIPVAASTSDGLTPATPNDVTQVLLGGGAASFGPVPIATSLKPGGAPPTPSDVTQVFLGGATSAWGPVPQVTHLKLGGLPTTPLAANYSPFTASDGSVSWLPGLPLIVVNTTLYVSTTGNDSTAQPGNPLLPWLTIQGALNYLSLFTILAGVTVTISVASGVYSITSPIAVNHPQGQSIKIIGQITAAVNSTSASGPSTTVTLNGPFTGINAGDYIIATCNTTELASLSSGVHVVLSSTGSALTFHVNGSITTLAGCTFSVRKLSTVIVAAAGINGINITGNGLGLLENAAVIGTQSGASVIYGILASGSLQATFQACGLISWIDSGTFSAGINASSGALVNCNDTHCCFNSIGFISNSASALINAASCIANGNVYGFRPNVSVMNCTQCTADGNTGYAYYVAYRSSMVMTQCAAYWNTNGLLALNGSSIFTQGTAACAFLNNTPDISLSVLSTFQRAGSLATQYATLSANITAANTLTSDGCWFTP